MTSPSTKSSYEKYLDKAKLREASFLLRKIAHINEDAYQMHTEADAPKTEFIHFFKYYYNYKQKISFTDSARKEIEKIFVIELSDFEKAVNKKIKAHNDELYNSYKTSYKAVYLDKELRERLIKFCVKEGSDFEDENILCTEEFISYANDLLA